MRALTRVAQRQDEDWLLAYALGTTAENVEERCRQMRNVAPESVHRARRAWANRSLTLWRNERRGVMRLTVEVPIEEGELVAKAIDCAVAGTCRRCWRCGGHSLNVRADVFLCENCTLEF